MIGPSPTSGYFDWLNWDPRKAYTWIPLDLSDTAQDKHKKEDSSTRRRREKSGSLHGEKGVLVMGICPHEGSSFMAGSISYGRKYSYMGFSFPTSH